MIIAENLHLYKKIVDIIFCFDVFSSNLYTYVQDYLPSQSAVLFLSFHLVRQLRLEEVSMFY